MDEQDDDEARRSQYERDVLVQASKTAIERTPHLRYVGASALGGGKKFADLEFINSATDEYHVVESKITYSSDKPNTVYKAIGQLLLECDKDLRLKAGKAAKVSPKRAGHSGRLRYGPLILWEPYDDLRPIPANVGVPPNHECSGVDFYGKRFGEMEDAIKKFEEVFNIQDVFVLKSNESSLYRMDWKCLPGASRENSESHLTLFAGGKLVTANSSPNRRASR